ncbi:hypothetical protein [Nocardia pseudovaccinii]|uniref:hypothetical protein n=1 Tax=Nocardia pseudovaccinii TaxID=189540 RepID=UPI0007A521CD|nr:hypothetical protein [Nocardia pseudovaccinii]
MNPDTDICQQHTPWRSTSADADERRSDAVPFERTNGSGLDTPQHVIKTRCHAEGLVDCRYFVDPEPPAVPGPDMQTLLDVLDGLTDPGADAAALAARLTPTAASCDARQR